MRAISHLKDALLNFKRASRPFTFSSFSLTSKPVFAISLPQKKQVLITNVLIVSSEKLADLCGVNPAQFRKDLAYFGEFGVRGVGYDVQELLSEIKRILGTDNRWSLCIVGMGNLGMSLVENDIFKERGYLFVAAFDLGPRKGA